MGSKCAEMWEKLGLKISAYHPLLMEMWDFESFALGSLVPPWILRGALERFS